MSKLSRKSLVFNRGFTIVELLVVIVVIGILAAITMISYTGITNKANEATLMSDLANAKQKIALYYAEHDKYPSYLDDTTKCLKNEAGVADNSYCLKPTTGNSFIYTPDSVTTPTSYELTANRGSINYKVTNDLAPAIVDLPVGQLLANWTWSQIAQVSAAGIASTYFQIGNTKDITLSTGEVLTMQIYGFNHDDKSDGTGKAGITFGTKDLMTAPKSINPGNPTNYYGWDGSDIRGWMNGISTTYAGTKYTSGTTSLYSQLPLAVQGVIKQVKKQTSGGYINESLVLSNDKVFMFSEIETNRTNGVNSVAGEGAPYPIFSGDASRIKRLSNGSGNPEYYWDRSASLSSFVYFGLVNPTGSYNIQDASVGYGICFGFSI